MSRNSEVHTEFMENLKWLSGEISPGLGGFLIGLITPKVYELLSDKHKKKWKETFPVHHGEVGVVLTGISIFIRFLLEHSPADNKYVKFAKKLCEIFIGVGAGLTLEDIKDYNEWFKEIR